MAQTLFGKGSDEKSEFTLTRPLPSMYAAIVRDSTVPSGKTTDSSGPPPIANSVLFTSSTNIMLLLLTDFIRPPLLTPALNESAMAIIVDGLTITPASSVVVKETTSDSFKLEYKNQRPNLFA